MSEELPAAPQTPRPRRRRGRKFLIALAVLLLAFGIFRGVVAYRAYAALAAFRAAGYAVSADDLAVVYRLPEGAPNAAPLYTEAFALINGDPKAILSDSDGTPLKVYEPYPPGVVEAMRTFVEHNGPMLAKLREAAAVEDCRYPVEFSFTALLPHLAQTRKLGRSLQVCAHCYAQTDRLDDATQCLLLFAHLAESLRHDPHLISQLARSDFYQWLYADLQRLLPRTLFQAQHLKALQTQLQRIDPFDSLRTMWVAEVPLTLPQFSSVDEYFRMAASVHIPLVPAPLYRWGGLSGLDEAYFLDAIGKLMRASRLPEDQIWAALIACEPPSKTLPWYCVVSRLALPSSGPAARTSLAKAMRLRLAVTALAVERLRLAEQRLPDSLDELVPNYLDAVPIDVFSGKPLRFLRRDIGYVIYSNGEDGVDDLGHDRSDTPATRPAGASCVLNRTEDLVFRVQRPSPTTPRALVE